MMDRCSAYADEVMRFRKGLNLTSISNKDDFYQRFITPSLDLLPLIPDGSLILDIGSGMGVPGIPLLMSGKGIRGILVERRKKRAEFLRHLVRKFKLDCQVYDADINKLQSLYVDVCVARAVTDEAGLLNMCSKHIINNGVAVLPVPTASCAVENNDWHLESSRHTVVMGEKQTIRCYRYNNSGGST